MTLGKRFAYFRNKIGLTQKEASERLSITPYQLGNYETNRSEPTIKTLIMMSEVYGVSIDQLVGNTAKRLPVTPLDEEEPMSIDEIKAALEEMIAKIDGNL